MPAASPSATDSRRLADRLGSAGLKAAHAGSTKRAEFCARVLRTAADTTGSRTAQRYVKVTAALDGAARDVESALGMHGRAAIAARIPAEITARTIEALEALHPGETFLAVLEGWTAPRALTPEMLHRAIGIVGRKSDGRLRERSRAFASQLVFQLAAHDLRAWKPLGIDKVVELMRGVPVLRTLRPEQALDAIFDAAEAVRDEPPAPIKAPATEASA